MDWLLIGNLTANRIGANTVGDTSPFMEGRQWLRDGATEAETAVISQQDFDDLMSYCSELDPNQIGGLSRIHGRGCESGLADGHLSRWPVLATVGGMKPSFGGVSHQERRRPWGFRRLGRLDFHRDWCTPGPNSGI
jgi:hypothetical protein